MLLDEHGTYHMSVGDFFEDPTIFQGHDMVTETTMTVTAIRVRGMDSFRNFEPLVAIGAQTFRSNMAIRLNEKPGKRKNGNEKRNTQKTERKNVRGRNSGIPFFSQRNMTPKP